MLWPYPSLKKKRKKKKYIFSSSYLVKQGMKGRTPRYAAIQLWVLWGAQCRTSENLDSLLTRSWSACIKVTGAPGGLVSQHHTGPIPLHCTPAITLHNVSPWIAAFCMFFHTGDCHLPDSLPYTRLRALPAAATTLEPRFRDQPKKPCWSLLIHSRSAQEYLHPPSLQAWFGDTYPKISSQ